MKKRDKKAASKKESATEKLQSSKFRFLNEKLYTTESKEAAELFKKEPELFEDVSEKQLNDVFYSTTKAIAFKLKNGLKTRLI
jgi:hypothetical protein